MFAIRNQAQCTPVLPSPSSESVDNALVANLASLLLRDSPPVVVKGVQWRHYPLFYLLSQVFKTVSTNFIPCGRAYILANPQLQQPRIKSKILLARQLIQSRECTNEVSFLEKRLMAASRTPLFICALDRMLICMRNLCHYNASASSCRMLPTLAQS